MENLLFDNKTKRTDQEISADSDELYSPAKIMKLQ